MVKVRFFTLLRLDLGIREIDISIDGEEKLIEVLAAVENKTPKPFLHKLIDEKGELLNSAIILVNGKNVHHLDKLDTIIEDGDEIDIFPPGGGG